jgi:hypothetical protein
MPDQSSAMKQLQKNTSSIEFSMNGHSRSVNFAVGTKKGWCLWVEK